MTRIAYLDMVSGISGDMLLGSLIDAGAQKSMVQETINEKLPLDAEINVEEVSRKEITAKKIKIISEKNQEGKSLKKILKLLDESGLAKSVKERSKEVFKVIGEVEGKVHGQDMDNVHFHEVGEIDSIIDIVGSIICLVNLEVDRLYYSNFRVGTGEVETSSGTYPVPGPATLELLKGQNIIRTDVESELTTPTGAALSTVLGKQDFPPSFELDNVGYGAGKNKLDNANVLRVEIGETSNDFTEPVWLLQTNIDDMNPELYEHVTEKLLEKGALDVWLNPISMKKGRPGILLSVLSPYEQEKLQELTDTIFKETSTIGIRKHRTTRHTLPREIKTINTEYGEIDVKIARKNNEIINIAPEHEQCKKLSEEKNIPLKRIYEKVQHKANEIFLE